MFCKEIFEGPTFVSLSINSPSPLHHECENGSCGVFESQRNRRHYLDIWTSRRADVRIFLVSSTSFEDENAMSKTNGAFSSGASFSLSLWWNNSSSGLIFVDVAFCKFLSSCGNPSCPRTSLHMYWKVSSWWARCLIYNAVLSWHFSETYWTGLPGCVSELIFALKSRALLDMESDWMKNYRQPRFFRLIFAWTVFAKKIAYIITRGWGFFSVLLRGTFVR